MAVESRILGIKISSISKIQGKAKDQVEKILDQLLWQLRSESRRNFFALFGFYFS